MFINTYIQKTIWDPSIKKYVPVMSLSNKLINTDKIDIIKDKNEDKTFVTIYTKVNWLRFIITYLVCMLIGGGLTGAAIATSNLPARIILYVGAIFVLFIPVIIYTKSPFSYRDEYIIAKEDIQDQIIA